MTLAALIFDVDGTIADTEELHRLAFNHAFRAHGLDWEWDRALYKDLLRVTGGKERIASYLQRLPLSDSERERLESLIGPLHATKTGRYRELVESGELSARPGMRDLMLDARAADIRLAIASTTSPANIEPLLRSALDRHALKWFDVIVSGDVVANKKPAPDIYNVALQKLLLSPDEAMAFEDSALGVQSARQAGLFTVALPNGWTQDQDLSAADVVLCQPLCLAQLTGKFHASRL